MKTSYTIPIAIIFGGIIVAGAVYFSVPKTPSITSNTGNPALVRPVGADDHILGNPTAKVVIVEYSDFDCEYCKGFDTTLHQIISTEGASGEVAWVYREFPIDSMQNAEAAECVAQTAGNDAFWKYADVLFANQPADPTQYGTYAQTIGISGNAFATCFENASSTVDARIDADQQNAVAIGAIGAPYSVILVNGQAPEVIDGAYSYDAMKQLVDEALANAQ